MTVAVASVWGLTFSEQYLCGVNSSYDPRDYECLAHSATLAIEQQAVLCLLVSRGEEGGSD